MKLAYYITNESWFAESATKHRRYQYEIMVAINPSEDGRIDAEFAIRWYQLDELTPRLEIYGDTWKFLLTLVPLFEALSALGSEATPDQVIAVLNSVGAQDVTARARP